MADLVNNLIKNTLDKFNIKKMAQSAEEREKKEKKEATYKKLMIFREF